MTTSDANSRPRAPRLAWLLLLLPLAGTVGAVGAAAAPVLRVLTWADYIDPAVVREFEAQRQARVEFTYFESDQVRDARLVAAQGQGFDVAVVDGVAIDTYRKRGWLAPLDAARAPNLKHVDAAWIDAYPGSRGYAAPYFWGTLGIAYRKDLVPEPVTSWMQLFRPGPALRGRIVVNRDSRELVGMALKALGFSYNTDDRAQILQAEGLLREQQPFVKTYGYPALTARSALVTGQVTAAMIFNGDALMLREHHPEIAFALPREGGELWVDYLAVLASSPRRDLAVALVDFLNRPRIAARVAAFVHYATPNRAAEQFLPREFFQDPVIYPGQEQLRRSEFPRQLPARALKLTNTVAARLFD